METSSKVMITICVAFICLIVFSAVVSTKGFNQFIEECHKKDGVVLNTTNRYVCIKKDAILLQ